MKVTIIRKPFNVNNPYFHYIIIELQIAAFKNYLKLVKPIIEKNIEAKLIKDEQVLIESDQFEIDHFFDWESYEILKNTQGILYNSLLITLYSFFEKKVFQIIKLAEPNYNIKIKDLHGEGIFKYYKYVQKVLKIETKHLNIHWQKIVRINKLRNRIVHNPSNEIHKDNNDKLIQTFRQIQYLHIIEKNESIFFEISDVRLIQEFLNSIGEFLYELYFERRH